MKNCQNTKGSPKELPKYKRITKEPPKYSMITQLRNYQILRITKEELLKESPKYNGSKGSLNESQNNQALPIGITKILQNHSKNYQILKDY